MRQLRMQQRLSVRCFEIGVQHFNAFMQLGIGRGAVGVHRVCAGLTVGGGWL